MKQKIDIDEVDRRLLQLLQQDVSRSNQDLALAVGLSAPTCLRRVRRLHLAGLIERQVAILRPEPLAEHFGEGLQAILEVTLERQSAQDLDAFEQRAVADAEVSQCWRVSAGPDFVLVVLVVLLQVVLMSNRLRLVLFLNNMWMLLTKPMLILNMF